MDVNVLSSAYTRPVENLVDEAIAQIYAGDIGVYYAKKEAIALLSGRVSFPKQLTAAIASDGIVHSFSEKVNMAILDVTQSLQFINWFGDWQNDPQRSSKVVNDDGTPMIVYHGSKSGNIKTFRTINKNGTGGLFLTTNRSVAEGFAGANAEVYETYVNIRNPFIVDAEVAFYDSISIPPEMNGSEAFAVVELENFKDEPYLNGYDPEMYNVLVTMYQPDAKKRVTRLLNGKDNIVIQPQKKERQLASYFRHPCAVGVKQVTFLL